MKRAMVYSNLFWLLFSTFVCIEAYRFKLGTIHTPGPGFFCFCAGLVMFLLALAALVQSILKPVPSDQPGSKTSVRWRNIVIIMAAIIAYAISLETVGFLINTFVFVCIMLKIIEPQTWKTSIFGGVIAAVVANVIFNIFFQAKIPSGILGF